MNTNYDVRLLYNETILDGSAFLKGMIISTYLYLSNLGSRGSYDLQLSMDQRLSPLKLRVRILLGERCIEYNIMPLSLPVTCGR